MINTIRSFAWSMMMLLAVLAITSVVVFYTIGPGLDRHLQRELQFRAACEEVKGRIVWNGNHWECLK